MIQRHQREGYGWRFGVALGRIRSWVTLRKYSLISYLWEKILHPVPFHIHRIPSVGLRQPGSQTEPGLNSLEGKARPVSMQRSDPQWEHKRTELFCFGGKKKEWFFKVPFFSHSMCLPFSLNHSLEMAFQLQVRWIQTHQHATPPIIVQLRWQLLSFPTAKCSKDNKHYPLFIPKEVHGDNFSSFPGLVREDVANQLPFYWSAFSVKTTGQLVFFTDKRMKDLACK